MTSFTITGRLQHDGRHASVTWTDGVLTGDAAAIIALRDEARRLNGRALGPIPGAETTTTEGHLSAPYSFVHLGSRVLWDLVVTGFPPSRTHPDLVNAPVREETPR